MKIQVCLSISEAMNGQERDVSIFTNILESELFRLEIIFVSHKQYNQQISYIQQYEEFITTIISILFSARHKKCIVEILLAENNDNLPKHSYWKCIWYTTE